MGKFTTWFELRLKDLNIGMISLCCPDSRRLPGDLQRGQDPGAGSASNGPSQRGIPSQPGGRHDETHPQTRSDGM